MSVDLWQKVEDARRAFASRWQLSNFGCVDGEFYGRFLEQERLWNEAYMRHNIRR